MARIADEVFSPSDELALPRRRVQSLRLGSAPGRAEQWLCGVRCALSARPAAQSTLRAMSTRMSTAHEHVVAYARARSQPRSVAGPHRPPTSHGRVSAALAHPSRLSPLRCGTCGLDRCRRRWWRRCHRRCPRPQSRTQDPTQRGMWIRTFLLECYPQGPVACYGRKREQDCADSSCCRAQRPGGERAADDHKRSAKPVTGRRLNQMSFSIRSLWRGLNRSNKGARGPDAEAAAAQLTLAVFLNAYFAFGQLRRAQLLAA